MSLFGNQSLRLIRERWEDANMLAEEMYAILRAVDSNPTTQDTPGTITSDQQGIPPLTLNPYPGDSTIMNFGTNGSLGSITFSDGVPVLSGPNGKKPPQGGGGDMGQIVSGSGSTYKVKLKSNGQTVTATQLQIAAGETIPAGTWTPVITISSQNGTSTVQTYYIQVPVWM